MHAIGGHAFGFEATLLVLLLVLVVAAQQVDVVRVEQLVGHEEHEALDAERAAIHVVAEEHVVLRGGRAVLSEDAHEVLELAVNVAHDEHVAEYLGD